MSHHSLTGRKITIRPVLDQASYWYYQKPSIVTRGVFQAYSMPIWDTEDNEYEQLYYRTRIPHRWDGITDVTARMYCYLRNSEDVGDKFKFNLSFQTIDGDVTVPSTDVDAYAETTLTSGHNAQYAKHTADFTIPASTLEKDDIFGARLRRVGATDHECTGEIAVIYLIMEYRVNKCFGVWQ